MGREALTEVGLGDAAPQTAKALLESTELLLRGALKARWPLAQLREPHVEGEHLRFGAPDGTPVALKLGAAEAARWLSRLRTPAPTLAAKLGLSAAQPAACFGPVDAEAELAEALHGARAEAPAQATQLIALVHSPDEVAQTLALHAGLPARFVWMVNVKGPRSPLGEDAIRTLLRARGYIDSKTCAVSARLSATRYGRAKAPA